MKLKQNPWVKFMFDPEDEGGTGVEIDTSAALDADLPGNEEEVETDSTTEVDEPEVVPAAPSGFDPRLLAEQFGGVLKETLKDLVPKEPAKPPMTPEERDKILGKLNLTPEFLAKLNNMDTQKEALVELHDGIVRYADGLSQVRQVALRREMETMFEERFGPVHAHYQQQQAEQQISRFGKAAPQLSDPKLRPLILAVGKQLTETGQTFKTEAEMFTAIAKGCEAVIKTTNPEFKLNVAAKAAKSSNPNALPAVSSGAGGGGGTGKQTVKKNDGTPKGIALAHLG